MTPLVRAHRCCAICEASIEDRASNVRYCSQRCRYRRNRLTKMRKFESRKADEMWAGYIEEQRRGVPMDHGEHNIGAVARKKLEEKRSDGVDSRASVPKRGANVAISRVNGPACSGECPKCGEVWRGSKNCRHCGYGFSAVMF